MMVFTDEFPLIRDLVACSEWVNLTVRKVTELCDTSERITKTQIFDSIMYYLHFVEERKFVLNHNVNNVTTELFNSNCQLKNLRKCIYF